MGLKDYACHIREVLPKVRFGILEWDTPEIVGEILSCNEKAETICFVDDDGRLKCEIVRREEPDSSSEILRNNYAEA